MPPAPPPALRQLYLKLSWAYVRWCLGMLVWAAGCIVYFILTSQMLEMFIAICLGLLVVAMIVLPALLFGGETWYKRLGWIMLLLAMFSLMFLYPIVMVAIGVTQRIREKRYVFTPTTPTLNDVWHLSLCVLTLLISFWTISITLRAARLVRQISRGDVPLT